ncbi:MAG: hypothetical protein LBH85_06930 [Treponema sp.]|jgi:hypothetical protein|nr:hypothetical protein [Treponema sp.]
MPCQTATKKAASIILGEFNRLARLVRQAFVYAGGELVKLKPKRKALAHRKRLAIKKIRWFRRFLSWPGLGR